MLLHWCVLRNNSKQLARLVKPLSVMREATDEDELSVMVAMECSAVTGVPAFRNPEVVCI